MIDQNLAPIVLFVYNRPWHLGQTIEALRNNKLAERSELFIFSDGAKSEKDKADVNSVRNIIRNVNGFKTIVITERKENLGLAKSVISGATEVLSDKGKVIVLEDDIVCSNTFLNYMNDLLTFYQSHPDVFSISGYNFPIEIPRDYTDDVYFALRPSSWGWGTWIDRWEKVDWNVSDYKEFIHNKEWVKAFAAGGNDLIRMLKKQMNGKIDSWAIRWAYAHIKNNAYCVYPITSRLKNIGADRSGVNTEKTKRFEVDKLNDAEDIKLSDHIQTDEQILQNFRKFFSRNKILKIIDYLKGITNLN
ncbi:MAG: glycosyltransferase [Ignavibacteria bacterium]|jgi:hypothetical protein